VVPLEVSIQIFQLILTKDERTMMFGGSALALAFSVFYVFSAELRLTVDNFDISKNKHKTYPCVPTTPFTQ
jgi:hypothetical protein